jgi:hypothetical protein
MVYNCVHDTYLLLLLLLVLVLVVVVVLLLLLSLSLLLLLSLLSLSLLLPLSLLLSLLPLLSLSTSTSPHKTLRCPHASTSPPTPVPASGVLWVLGMLMGCISWSFSNLTEGDTVFLCAGKFTHSWNI